VSGPHVFAPRVGRPLSAIRAPGEGTFPVHCGGYGGGGAQLTSRAVTTPRIAKQVSDCCCKRDRRAPPGGWCDRSPTPSRLHSSPQRRRSHLHQHLPPVCQRVLIVQEWLRDDRDDQLRGETCMRGTLSAQLSVLRRCPCSPAARAGQRCPPSDAPRRPQLNRELRSPGLLCPCDGGAW